MIHYYSRVGLPITRECWLHLWNDPGYQLVAYDEINGAKVTTRWVGYSDRPRTEPEPYQSTVVNLVGTAVYGARSESEARRHHRDIVAQLSGPDGAHVLVIDPGRRL